MKLIILLFQIIFSLPASNDELLQKLKDYRDATGITDDLMMHYFKQVGYIISYCIWNEWYNIIYWYYMIKFSTIKERVLCGEIISKINVWMRIQNFDISQTKMSSLVNIFITKLKNSMLAMEWLTTTVKQYLVIWKIITQVKNYDLSCLRNFLDLETRILPSNRSCSRWIKRKKSVEWNEHPS